jgi:UDP-glucose 4-epimerase
MKILITGGAGFLGAWIAKRLVEKSHEVRIFDRSDDARLVRAIVGPGCDAIDFRTGDVTVAADVLAAAEGCASVAHLAALLTPACQADPVRGANVNVNGTLNVFEAARKLGLASVVYASSAGVFGPVDGVHPEPSTLYGAYKLACEGIGRAYAVDHGVANVGFRPLVVYGPGREVGSTAGASLACRNAVEGRPYAIPFTGETDLIFVDDVAAAFEAALLRPISGAHVFNLRGEIAGVDAIMAQIRALVPGAQLTAEGPPVPIKADIEAHDLAPVLGPLPTTPLSEGLRRTVAFYQHAARPAA